MQPFGTTTDWPTEAHFAAISPHLDGATQRPLYETFLGSRAQIQQATQCYLIFKEAYD